MASPRLIGFLVFTVPALILIVPGAGETACGILAFLGLVKIIRERRNPLAEPGNRFLAVICWGFLLVAIISVLAAGASTEGFRRLGTSIHFLLAPLIGILFLNTPGIFTRFIQGVKAGAILAGIVALGQLIVRPDAPANGVVNEIVFGDLALLLGFLAMVGFFKETSKEKTVSAIALGLGLVAALLSETRGTWVAAPILTLVLMIIWWKGGHLSTRRLAITFSAAVLAAIICVSTPVFQHRYSQLVDELKNPGDYSEVTSIRERLVMWKAGWKTSFDAPLLGHGLHQANQAVLPQVESPNYQQRIAGYTHLHNEFVNTLVGKGLLGLASLLLLLFGPVLLLKKSLKPGPDYTCASISILVCLGFAIFGLTNLAFGHGIMNTFFVFIIAIALNQVRQESLVLETSTSPNKFNDPIPAPTETLSVKTRTEPQA